MEDGCRNRHAGIRKVFGRSEQDASRFAIAISLPASSGEPAFQTRHPPLKMPVLRTEGPGGQRGKRRPAETEETGVIGLHGSERGDTREDAAGRKTGGDSVPPGVPRLGLGEHQKAHPLRRRVEAVQGTAQEARWDQTLENPCMRAGHPAREAFPVRLAD